MKKIFVLFATFFCVISGGKSGTCCSELFEATIAETAVACQKSTINIALKEQTGADAIPSVALRWIDRPEGREPDILPGVPETDVVFWEPGTYVFDVEVRLIRKVS